MGLSKHDEIANKIARKEGAEYNQGKGPDIKTSHRIIEVATHEGDLRESVKQLQGFKKSRYLATVPELKSKALEITKDTKIGVMGSTGNIVKRAGGGKRS